MSYLLLCIFVFSAAYVVNMTFITVFYHRGLTHGAVKFSPATAWALKHLGIWVTGLDPVAWTCMHRRHHKFSDTPKDPHSPVQFGIPGVLWAQYLGYNRTVKGLIAGDPEYADYVRDVPFGVNWLKVRNFWLAPYFLHGFVGLFLAYAFNGWAVGFCYWFGMLSHPIQGWMVNSFGHAVGYRNFATDDQSRNNTFVGWTVMGEGFQNNHHAYPASAKFSCRWFEFDPGWLLCLGLDSLGLISIERDLLIPGFSGQRTAPALHQP
ncbi:MAG: hypothetical protein RIQ81_1712 [Pseudomonadota bacterium]|jgi:stearoyl-CoA desaturase (delta-9 desaturase)